VVSCTEPFSVRNKAHLASKIKVLEANSGRGNLRNDRRRHRFWGDANDSTKTRLEAELKYLRGLL
jgi:hypothetical protein